VPGHEFRAVASRDRGPVEQLTLEGGVAGAMAEDIETAGAEFGRILEEIRKASDAITGGPLVETTIALSRVTLVFRAVDEDTFLVVALTPDGNLGKARYLIRKQLPALHQLL
jgi:predicted regulator of Ras-like GTPase activity (Roadblock/LC7/MglB family)